MSVPSHFAPYKGFLQIAYVTTDFDRALSEFAAQYGVPTWLQLRNLEIETGKDRSCRTHVALTYVGATQLEVIQALGGDDTVYRHGLPEQGYAVRLNHLAQLIDTEAEFDAIHDDVVAQGIPVSIYGTGGGGTARYFYTDHRASLGHYVEHVWYSPEGLAFLREQIPHL